MECAIEDQTKEIVAAIGRIANIEKPADTERATSPSVKNKLWNGLKSVFFTVISMKLKSRL